MFNWRLYFLFDRYDLCHLLFHFLSDSVLLRSLLIVDERRQSSQIYVVVIIICIVFRKDLIALWSSLLIDCIIGFLEMSPPIESILSRPDIFAGRETLDFLHIFLGYSI